MTDTPSTPTPSAPTAAPSSTPSSTSAPAGTSTPAQNTTPAVDRSRGHSPALDAREQQSQTATAGKVSVNGVDYDAGYLTEMIARDSEAAVRRQGLPQSPDGYQIELPKDFAPPAGVSFEFNKDDPLLAHARHLAHQRGIDQSTFSDMLGVYAANKIAEQQQLAIARNAELGKLGATGAQRVGHIEIWLKAMAGADAATTINQLKSFPHEGMVKMFESIMSRHSNQGAAPFDQRGRNNEQNEGKIPGYETMNFAQRRAAQWSHMTNGRGDKR
jgi:hypothetical protein